MEELVLSTKTDIIIDVFNFFTSEANNPQLFERIKAYVLTDPIAKLNINYEARLAFGYFSCSDYMHYVFNCYEEKDRIKLYPNGIPDDLINRILNRFESNHIIQITDHYNMTPRERYYKACVPIAKFLNDKHMLLSKVLGFNYVAKTYNKSVFKIDIKDDDSNTNIGNAFLCTFLNKTFLISNFHVTGSKISNFKVFDIDNHEYTVNNLIYCEKRDLSIVKLDSYGDAVAFKLSNDLVLLSEILTIGYPPVPFTRDSYLLLHKGEINSIVQTYNNLDFFIFSAKTNPGNSGGPVVNSYGNVLGIITQQLEEQEWYKNSKLPYYAAIPSKIIMDFISEKFNYL
ncbi:S1 family peptidase [Flectobacillus roseus]|uniref:Serine protease n=1 Tax=Flectobacillus roseus TaxID=502259 RepID=A0ABT6Y8H4_9BACT|nr:serine protease [Flectobacillus roseus]MDI9859879.1 serine protease [Flectobacillus roseus]